MDVIFGIVVNIIDGDTFVIKVISEKPENKYKYGSNETIRIEEIDAPELNTKAGKNAKVDLEKYLSNKNVSIEVASRDTYGRIVGKVKQLN